MLKTEVWKSYRRISPMKQSKIVFYVVSSPELAKSMPKVFGSPIQQHRPSIQFQLYGITSWFILLASNPPFKLHVVVFPPSLQQLKGTSNSVFFSRHLLSAQSVKFTIPQHLSFMENKQAKCLLFGCLFTIFQLSIMHSVCPPNFA